MLQFSTPLSFNVHFLTPSGVRCYIMYMIESGYMLFLDLLINISIALIFCACFYTSVGVGALYQGKCFREHFSTKKTRGIGIYFIDTSTFILQKLNLTLLWLIQEVMKLQWFTTFLFRQLYVSGLAICFIFQPQNYLYIFLYFISVWW